MHSGSNKHPWLELIPVALLAAVISVGSFGQVGFFEKVPLCAFHFVTGFPCPGCGLTRAFISMFHGEFSRAIAFNALAPVLFVLMLLYFYRALLRFSGRCFEYRSSAAGRRWISASFLLLFFGQWGLKLIEQFLDTR